MMGGGKRNHESKSDSCFLACRRVIGRIAFPLHWAAILRHQHLTPSRSGRKASLWWMTRVLRWELPRFAKAPPWHCVVLVIQDPMARWLPLRCGRRKSCYSIRRVARFGAPAAILLGRSRKIQSSLLDGSDRYRPPTQVAGNDLQSYH